MAQRRMFSKTITNSSNFLMMSPSAQNLYFHLGMNADDDGFCELFQIMRMVEAKPDDLNALHSRGLVFVFDQKVLIIKDWKEHNYIPKDRYAPSKYLKVYKDILDAFEIEIKTRIQPVYEMSTQVRLGKVRLGKGNNDAIASDMFESFWREYPPTRKQDKQKCIKKWNSLTNDGESTLANTIIIDVIKRKNKHSDWVKNNGQFVPTPLVYLNNARWEAPIVEGVEKASTIILN